MERKRDFFSNSVALFDLAKLHTNTTFKQLFHLFWGIALYNKARGERTRHENLYRPLSLQIKKQSEKENQPAPYVQKRYERREVVV